MRQSVCRCEARGERQDGGAARSHIVSHAALVLSERSAAHIHTHRVDSSERASAYTQGIMANGEGQCNGVFRLRGVGEHHRRGGKATHMPNACTRTAAHSCRGTTANRHYT